MFRTASSKLLKHPLFSKKSTSFKEVIFKTLAVSILVMFLIELIHRKSFLDILSFLISNPFSAILGLILIFAINLPSLFFKRRKAVSFLINCMLLLFTIANSVVVAFRKTPITAADMFSIKDGLDIASSYLTPLNIVLLSLSFILVIIAVVFIFKKDKGSPKPPLEKVGALLFAVIVTFNIMLFSSKLLKIVDIVRWDVVESYSSNGLLLSFYDSFLDGKMRKPKGYSGESVEKISNYIDNSKESLTDVPPNIIFVQLESFFDPTIFTGINFKEDPIPNFRRYSNESVSGMLQVPSFGGGTVRGEFEVLSGVDMEYLAPGEIPYNSVVKTKAIDSIAYTLKDNGYKNSIIHNYTGNFYNRNKVYSNLGFDSMVSIEYMSGLTYNENGWADDSVNFKYIEELIASNDDPQFIFNITVGGHGGYTTTGVDVTDFDVEGLTLEQASELQTYCTVLKGVDAYVKSLVDYVKSIEEPTVLVVYSDHLPALNITSVNDVLKDDLTETLYGRDIDKDTLNDGAYKTPYFITDNINLFDIETTIDMEAYQLSSYILDALHIKTQGLLNLHSSRELFAEPIYDQVKKIMQYDILKGKSFSLPNERVSSRLMMGESLISYWSENIYYDDVYGLVVNMPTTPLSCNVYVNGKKISQVAKSDTQIILDTKLKPEDVQIIEIAPTGRYGEELSRFTVYEN